MKTPADEAAFVQLLTTHQSAIHAFVMGLMRGVADADDVMQDTNVVLWEKRDQFQIGTNFKAWAFTVARLQVMAWQKRQKHRRVLAFDDDLLDVFATEMPAAFSDFEDRRKVLRTCMGQLPDEQRRLLTARYADSRTTIKACAAALGRSAGALRISLFRLRQSLKQCIRLNLEESPG